MAYPNFSDITGKTGSFAGPWLGVTLSKDTRSTIFAAVIVAAALALAAASVVMWPVMLSTQRAWLVPTLVLLVALAGRFPFRVSPQGDATVLTVPLLIAVLMLHPAIAVTIGAVGTAIAEILIRPRLKVAVFNVGANSLTAALAGITVWWLDGGNAIGEFTAIELLYAVAAGLVLYVSNLAILFGMITIIKGSGFWQRWREAWSFEAFLDISLLLYGLLAVQLTNLAWWWLVVLSVPFIVNYYGYRRSVQQAVEKTKLAEELAENLSELKQAQAQVVQSAKLAGIGTLAAGLAHEINNPLTIVTGRAELFLTKLERDPAYGSTPQAARDVRDIKAMGERMSTIMKQLLSYSRRAEYLSEVDLEAILDDSVQLLNGSIQHKGINLVKQYGSVPLVRGVANQLQQVFVNLISNAIDAVPGQGTVTVGTCYQDGTARVFVQDTGAGIPPEIQERLFEPFFTTKDVGKGTGLGLYISHKIVTEHDGSIALESQVGRGTTVSVSLPATAIATPDEGKSASAA